MILGRVQTAGEDSDSFDWWMRTVGHLQLGLVAARISLRRYRMPNWVNCQRLLLNADVIFRV